MTTQRPTTPPLASAPPTLHAPRSALALILAASASLLGCRAASDLGTVRLGDRATAAQRSPQTLQTNAFRADQPTTPSTPAPTQPDIPIRTAEQADRGVNAVVAVPGPPEQPRPRPPAPLDDVQPAQTPELVIDQVVGQINGRPVFADAFFQSMDARLRAQAAQVTNESEAREFIISMNTDIANRLNEELRNQLLLDEFQASLSPEERVGVAALIDRIQTDLQRGALGSRELADRRARDEFGLSLDERARALGDEAFIREQLRRTVANRVSVSSRDIKQEYERRRDEFNPPPVASLRIIRVAADDRPQIESELSAGQPFAEVAARHSRWRPDADNLHEITLPPEGIAAAQFFALPALNDAARSLNPGAVAGPITAGTSAWWIRLDEIRQPPQLTLFDVQLQLEQDIRDRRFAEEQERYFTGLLERSNFSDRRQMVDRLTAFGSRRYLGIAIPELEAANTAQPTPPSPPAAGPTTPTRQ